MKESNIKVLSRECSPGVEPFSDYVRRSEEARSKRERKLDNKWERVIISFFITTLIVLALFIIALSPVIVSVFIVAGLFLWFLVYKIMEAKEL